MIAGYKLINPHTKEPTGFVEKIENGTKIHTIRRGDRWSKAFEKAEKEGRELLIQHSIGVRTKGFYNFQTNVVKRVQSIYMTFERGQLEASIDDKYVYLNTVDLFKNDGFETREDFENWFTTDIEANGPFIGEIIHWTDLKY